jgi:hypothetical protein
MNEQIKSIALECYNPYGNFDLEKFAKLIVLECAKRVDYWESRQGEHTEDLLKHFGVAE